MHLIKKCILSIGLFLFWVPLSSIAQDITLEPLESVRDSIVFDELTAEDKLIMAEQAQIFLRDLYVHRFEKIDFYPESEDPVPAIAEVVNNVDSLTTTELEEAIYNIFVSQRDLHLNYIFPAPHNSFRSFLPLTFTRTESRDDFFEVRINAVDEETFRSFAPDQRIPEVGDRVVSYDHLPIAKAVDRQLATAQGANRFGGFTRALGQMTFVSHLLHLVPEENEVTMTLVSGKGRRSDFYTITLPWVVEVPTTSLSTSEFSSSNSSQKIDIVERLNEGKDLWQDEFNKFVSSRGLKPESSYPSNPSNEPALTWGVIDNQHGSFGYFNLSSFSPNSGTDFTINEIQRIIFEEFSETDGLIFDVRNNGGGSIVLADRLSQLFSRDEAQVISARLLNSDLNRTIFNASTLGPLLGSGWSDAINAVEGSDSIHTDIIPFTSDTDANDLGQSYYKPVAVLANARSYSATDLFTCSMRDNSAALVYGEDPLTGAGGANVITHDLFNDLGPVEFVDLPGDHAMRVSWRQSIRFGRSEGQVIEDFGCEADVNVSQTQNDLLNGGEDQIETITRGLAKSAFSLRYLSQAQPSQYENQVYIEGAGNYDVFVKNTAFINVIVDGAVADQIPVFTGWHGRNIEIPLPDQLAEGSINFVTFEGVSLWGERLWNIKRQFVVLGEEAVIEEDGLIIDFASQPSIDPFVVLNNNLPEDGWNLLSPNLQVGFNPEYVNNVNTDAVLLMDLTALSSANLSFDLEIDTELGFDFIDISIEDSAGNVVTLIRQSGFSQLSTYSFDISDFAGQAGVLLHFRFTSDGSVVAPGVKLQRLEIN